MPSNFTAASVSDLIADIDAANKQGGTNTITLVAPANSPYKLTTADNSNDGPNGLPVIAANDNLTIVGNGDIIARSSATGTAAFRLFDVAPAASLALANLTLQGGLAFGSGVWAYGGGIYNQGTLDLNGVNVQDNTAQGQNGAAGFQGASAWGGGIYSSGALTMEGGCTIHDNQALGGQGGGYRSFPHVGGVVGTGGSGWGGGLEVNGGTATLQYAVLSGNSAQGGQGHNAAMTAGGGWGGEGFGGGLDVNSGTITLANDSLSGNSARGGQGANKPGNGGWGGLGLGGGLEIERGTITMHNDIVTGNMAQGGAGGNGAPTGEGLGGGLAIEATALVYLDAITVENIIDNTASTNDPKIHGPYTIVP